MANSLQNLSQMPQVKGSMFGVNEQPIVTRLGENLRDCRTG